MSLMVSVDVKHHGRRSLAWHGVPSRHDKSLQPTAFTEGLMLTSSASWWYETRPDCNIQYTNIQRGGRKFLGHFKRRLGSQISLESVSYLANNANNYLQQNWVWLVSVKGDSSVHDRWFCRHQFSSRWYLCARKSPYALHPVSQKFAQRCLWNGSNVRLIDDGPLSFFQGRSSSAFSFHASLLQAIDGVMSLALCRHQHWGIEECTSFLEN